eukprot:GGOE01001763.1.p1 GENE.GGOE01001763.1~~GGOE01001763.1.p1  ORF type:complete len:1011 (+),score=170.21 GGOE01001763.1:68-3034(+)
MNAPYSPPPAQSSSPTPHWPQTGMANPAPLVPPPPTGPIPSAQASFGGPEATYFNPQQPQYAPGQASSPSYPSPAASYGTQPPFAPPQYGGPPPPPPFGGQQPPSASHFQPPSQYNQPPPLQAGNANFPSVPNAFNQPPPVQPPPLQPQQPAAPQLSPQQGAAFGHPSGPHMGNTYAAPPTQPFTGQSFSNQAPPCPPPMQQAQLQEQPKYQLLPLTRPVFGPNAGKVLGVENFPRYKHSDYHAKDPGQALKIPSVKGCNPHAIRTTFGSIPQTQPIIQIMAKWAVPFGAIVQPLAPSDVPLPVVNFAKLGNLGVVRCRTCLTYVNPYVQFTEGGRRWICTGCRNANSVPQEYYCPLDGNGQRRDLFMRPELTNGSCEFVAPPEYMVRPPQRPAYVFLLDVSTHAIASGMLATACEVLADNLGRLPGDDRTMVSVITFDSQVHYYNLKSSLPQAKMVVSPELSDGDTTDIQVPLPDDLFVNLHESEAVVSDLLKRLPTMFANSKNVETAFGPALCGALKLIASFGGKLMCFLSSIPSWGVGRLVNRDDRKLYGTPQEKELLQPAGDWYKETAIKCSTDQVSIDLYLVGMAYMDVATLNQLAKHTGGQVTYIRNFTSSQKAGSQRLTPDELKLRNQLMRNLSRETGFEAVMRIRCTVGFKITHFFGHFNIRGQDLMGLPNVDEDKAVAILVAHNPQANQPPTSQFCIQAALLYTTSGGERRIRVHTLCLPVASSALQLYQSIDTLAMANLMLKMAIDKVLVSGVEGGRSYLLDTLVSLLKAFLTFLGHEQRAGSGLIMPEVLALLPVTVSAMLKGPSLRSDNDTSADDRSAHLAQAMTIGTSGTLSFFHPRLYNMLQTVDQKRPVLVDTSSNSLDPTNVFLLDSGYWLTLWVGRRTRVELLDTLFGVDRPEDVTTLAPLSPFNAPALELVETIQKTPNGIGSPPLVIVRQGTPQERTHFLPFLVEDEYGGALSYTNLLCNLQRRVQAMN